jgi:c-di-GMP-related signal transduction protein
LLGGASRLRPLYQLMLAQESGEWAESAELAKQLQLKDDEVSDMYWQAVQWSRQVTGGGEEEKPKSK